MAVNVIKRVILMCVNRFKSSKDDDSLSLNKKNTNYLEDKVTGKVYTVFADENNQVVQPMIFNSRSDFKNRVDKETNLGDVSDDESSDTTNKDDGPEEESPAMTATN